MAPTLEDCEFLHALVRVTKPVRVLELGSGRGVSGRFITEALVANGVGGLLTLEPVQEHADAARELLAGLPCEVTEWPSEIRDRAEPDMVFIDSGWETREWDIEWWLTDTRALVVVHDANRDYVGIRDFGVGVLLPGSDGLWIGRAK